MNGKNNISVINTWAVVVLGMELVLLIGWIESQLKNLNR